MITKFIIVNYSFEVSESRKILIPKIKIKKHGIVKVT